MDELYLDIELKNEDGDIFISIQSFIALYVYRYLENPTNIKLKFVTSILPSGKGKLKLRQQALGRELKDENIICIEDTPIKAICDLRLPVYLRDDNTFIAGMCSVCREMVLRQSCSEYCKLLGFKESCLLAPAETSIWTRFCELDVPEAISRLLQHKETGETLQEVPLEAARFENHMREPVRMHNIYKLAREQANSKEKTENITHSRREKVIIDCRTPKEQLLIEHRFAEGVAFTIADLILYPYLYLIYYICFGMLPYFPLTSAWLNEIRASHGRCYDILYDLYGDQLNTLECHRLHPPLKIPESTATSLYKSDPKRYKPRNRIYTEKDDVCSSIEKAKSLGLAFSSDNTVVYNQEKIDWNSIEPNHGKNSDLPPERLIRKRQQLENLANAVQTLAVDGERIIDFCSGTGHLGILLALQLPNCTVVLMENKSISLERAKKRAKELNLKNVCFYQCNIDYFQGTFDIGTSLHACGTATDIVLQQCQRSRAKFVCCPCCYGAMQPMPHISYPLSQRFRSIVNEKDFLHIGHTADQAHELGTLNCTAETTRQGQLCMAIVDTDRKLKAEEAGYTVILTRLKPEKCSPKNHLLVGYASLER